DGTARFRELPEPVHRRRAVREAAMRTLRTLAIAIPLALALVDPAAAGPAGMESPYKCINPWPGWVDCGTLSSTPTVVWPHFCGDWVHLDPIQGMCGNNPEPGVGNAGGPTSPAGQVVPVAEPVDATTGIFMLTKVDAAFPGVAGRVRAHLSL